MIAALFVQTGGVYFGLPDVDPWDEARDARLYAGPWPVVAHPVCSAWGRLAPINQARYGHKVGDDAGCFASALCSVERWGGVLEHPAESRAWKAFSLPLPHRGRWREGRGFWVTEVSQRAYGHRAQKRTWLLVRSWCCPAPMDWSDPEPEATISFLSNHGDSGLPRLSKREASATPPAFRDILLSIARTAQRRAA